MSSSNIKEQFKNLGVGGDIFAAATVSDIKTFRPTNIIDEYCKGIETFDIDSQDEHSWIVNGQNDNMFILYKKLLQRSSIHSSAISLKTALISGGGIEFEKLNEYYEVDEFGFHKLVKSNMTDNEVQSEIQKAREFSMNVKLSEFVNLCAHQLAVYGNCFYYSVFTKDENNKTRLRRLLPESTPNCRLGSKRKDRRSKNIYLSDDWGNSLAKKVIHYSKYEEGVRLYRNGNVTYLPVFTNDVYTENKTGRFMSHFARHTEHRDFYGTPDYETLDALTYIEIDYLLSLNDLTQLKSGFALDYIVVRYRNKREDEIEEQKAKNKDLESVRNHKGVQGSNAIMLWVEPHSNIDGDVSNRPPIEIITIPNNNNAERNSALRLERTQKILNAHRITAPEFIGLQNQKSSGFSNLSDLLITAMEQMYWGIIAPYQSLIIKELEAIFRNEGIKVRPVINQSKPNLRLLSETIMNNHYTTNEIREKYGDERLTDEDLEKLQTKFKKDGV